MNISCLKCRLRTLQEKFKSEFKPIIENLQEKLHQGRVNNQKVQKVVSVFDKNLSVKNAPKLSAKYLEDKIFKIKIMQNISVTLRTFLTLVCIKWVPDDPRTLFLTTIFAQKMPESSGLMYSSILLLGNIYFYFT